MITGISAENPDSKCSLPRILLGRFYKASKGKSTMLELSHRRNRKKIANNAFGLIPYNNVMKEYYPSIPV